MCLLHKAVMAHAKFEGCQAILSPQLGDSQVLVAQGHNRGALGCGNSTLALAYYPLIVWSCWDV